MDISTYSEKSIELSVKISYICGGERYSTMADAFLIHFHYLIEKSNPEMKEAILNRLDEEICKMRF